MRSVVNPSAGKMLLFLAAMLGAAPLGAHAADAPDPHAHHRRSMESMKRATRSLADYKLPSVSLVRDDGKTVSLPEELDDGKPVVLNFVFTTCSTICPVMSQVFSSLQAKLGGELERARAHMVSISIDPEQDTPPRLAAYAKKFHAGPQWHHYTGSAQASIAVQRAFAAYRGDKMDHTPVTFLRAAPGRPWVRIDGFASADELAAEFRDLVAAH